MNPRPHIVAFAALLAAGAAAPPPAAAADRPPQTLHRVGDHWTAWDPPASFPTDVEVTTIARGDTLWDLAARNLGDPYLWPQIWERNRYILDAHWIYPGDPLLLGLGLTTTEIPPGAPLAEAEPALPSATAPEAEQPRLAYRTAGAAASEPVPLGTESDLYCSGFIGGLDENLPYTIVGSEYQAMSPTLTAFSASSRKRYRQGGHRGIYGTDTLKVGLDVGDIVYLGEGRGSGLEPGKLLTAVLPEEKVRHPLTGAVAGRFYRYLGRVRVLSVQADSAIAEIVHACDPVIVGSQLQDFTPEPVPLGRRTGTRPVNLAPSPATLAGAPVILRAEDNVVSLAEDNLVYIDRGDDAGVVPGDVYTIYRANVNGLPPLVLGELAVLSVHPQSSVARILRSRYTVYIGDLLELK